MPGWSIVNDGLVSERSGADRVNPAPCPRCSSGATVTKSAAGWYWSVLPSSDVRKAADDVTVPACSSRTMTSRTGRSPMLVTVPLTVTTGSLVVVTTSGVT
ncbi:hypothetical protein NIIDMKKI_76950 [Mycobacterium kansasii]|uniref:Uncharacterized protein n=1 Tax=Mycobacterium kansasii TaxID=1768 RepID=A0A7G1IR98_MYCKA|nr:hypothetical protein NIIDMKKI_76950 [Mycobacterium kansasii]